MVSSAHVTGDIGFKPTKGLKWKGKKFMTQRELQVESVMRRIQTRSKADGHSNKVTSQRKITLKENFLVVWLWCPTKLEIVFYVLMNLWFFKQT